VTIIAPRAHSVSATLLTSFSLAVFSGSAIPRARRSEVNRLGLHHQPPAASIVSGPLLGAFLI
jgi:hypothetical protein